MTLPISLRSGLVVRPWFWMQDRLLSANWVEVNGSISELTIVVIIFIIIVWKTEVLLRLISIWLMVAIIWKLNHNTYIFISQSSKFDFAVTLFLFPSSMYSLFLYSFVLFISFCFIPFHSAKTRLLLSFEAVIVNEDSPVTWDKSF